MKKILTAILVCMVALCAVVPVMAADVPELPTATVTALDVENLVVADGAYAPELTFALNFEADEVTEEQLTYYGKWYADFVLTLNKDITFDANGTKDGYLSGQYDDWSKDWLDVPYNKSVTLEANTPLKIMEYAAELMGEPGLKYTYFEVYDRVKDFDCGVYFTPEYIAANPDLEVTLELRMYNNEDETESYVIGETYVFTIEEDYVPTLALVAKMTHEEDYMPVIMVAPIPSLDYKEAGFDYIVCDAEGNVLVEERRVTTTVAYETITVSGKQHSAGKDFGMEGGFLVGHKLKFTKDNYTNDTVLKLRSYTLDFDGNYVYSEYKQSDNLFLAE